MGGLISRFFTEVLGGDRDVRQTIAIGTPFQGAAKAVLTLSDGHGTPLPVPRRRLRELARSLPSIYELLPSYRCVAEEGGITRRLTARDVISLGGDADLADAAIGMHRILDELPARNLRTMIGTEQQTPQSVRIKNGTAEPLYYILEDGNAIDWGGDGTVYAQVASGGIEPIFAIVQSHGALARTPEIVAALRAALTSRRLGPPMGSEGCSVLVPESVIVNAPFEIRATSNSGVLTAKCRIVDAQSAMQVAKPVFTGSDGELIATTSLPRPGIYRIEVKSGSASANSNLVMAVAA
jgi:hypothetical protein